MRPSEMDKLLFTVICVATFWVIVAAFYDVLRPRHEVPKQASQVQKHRFNMEAWREDQIRKETEIRLSKPPFKFHEKQWCFLVQTAEGYVLFLDLSNDILAYEPSCIDNSGHVIYSRGILKQEESTSTTHIK